MRRLRFAAILASCAVFFLPPALRAQFDGGINGIDWAGTVQKRPYTATWIQKTVRNAIRVKELTTRYARDSSGRIYEDFQIREELAAAERRFAEHLFVEQNGLEETHSTAVGGLYDPVARTVTWWISNTKQARVIHYADSDASALLKTFWGEPRLATPDVDGGGSITGADFNPVKPEDLGTKTIVGVTAHGARLTTPQVIRGFKPLTITIETWWSNEYGVLLQKTYSTHYDSATTPDLWSNTLEVTDFRPGEPDAALFRAPDGSAVKDVVQ